MGLKHVLCVTFSYKGGTTAVERTGWGLRLNVVPQRTARESPTKTTELSTTLIRMFSHRRSQGNA